MVESIGGAIGGLSFAAVAQTIDNITVTIDEIENIAKTTVNQAGTDAGGFSSDFNGVHTPASSFSDVPKALDIGAHQAAAHQVFADAIKGVVSDLETFRDQLIASAQAHASTDDSSYAALVALGRRTPHYQGRPDLAQQPAPIGDAQPSSDAAQSDSTSDSTSDGSADNAAAQGQDAPSGASQDPAGSADGQGSGGYAGQS